MKNVLVIGSICVDNTLYTNVIPSKGMTVFADDYFTDYVFLYEPDNTSCEKIIVEEEYDQIESGDKLAYKYEYAYNDKGLRTAETFYRDNDEGTLDLIRQKNYEYDDMDRIKEINDSWGHEEGDNAIKEISTILSECAPESILSRIEGDQFLICTFGKDLRIKTEEMIHSINHKVEKRNQYTDKYYQLRNKKADHCSWMICSRI